MLTNLQWARAVALGSALCWTVIGSANAQTGTPFVHGLTWGQIRDRATHEQKYILVDACGSNTATCHLLDSLVFGSPDVDAYVGSHFVAIQLSADTGTSEIAALARKYIARTSPSLLFLSSDGTLVERGGPHTPAEFLALAAQALDPRQQTYTLFRAYLGGQKDSSIMVSLARRAYDLREDSIVRVVSLDYLNHDLGVRPLHERLTKSNIELAAEFMQSSSDSAFSLFYRHAPAVDSVMVHPMIAEEWTSGQIANEEIWPHLWRDKRPLVERPDWEAMRRGITAKYGRELGDRVIVDAQIGWGERRLDWPGLVTAVVAKWDRFGVDTANPGGVNDMIYTVLFKHSGDRVVLSKAIQWMDVVLRLQPRNAQDIDTYANLLYKTGRTQEALKWEEKAAALSGDDPDIGDTLAKMRRGEPTWVTDGASVTH